ncbi:MAG: YbhB/YbcL family Raf kinase inhibitor-like protein [Lentisphaeria bacterium]
MNTQRFISLLTMAVLFLTASCDREKTDNQQLEGGDNMKQLQLTSSAFSEGEMIPAQFTCEGKDISPPLSWTGVPEEAESLALIVDDPDAPAGTWVHWVVYNIPTAMTELPENFPPVEKAKNGLTQGMNDFKKIGYGGPCPPSGTHRYFFKVYALSEELNLDPGATKQELTDAMEGKVVAQGALMGKYSRR